MPGFVAHPCSTVGQAQYLESTHLIEGKRFPKLLVPRRGLEPPRLVALVPETSASTNSATWAAGIGTERSGLSIERLLAGLYSVLRNDPVFPPPMTAKTRLETLVTVFGGSGFLGRHVVRALASGNTASASRCAGPSSPAICGRWAGSARSTRSRPICAIRSRSRRRCATPTSSSTWSASCSSAAGSVSTLCRPRRRGVALAAKAAGAQLVHVSAIGADANAPSHYAQSKAEGERLVLAALPEATIMRPSIVFGPEDDFFNRFAALARMAPALPLPGGGQRGFSRSSSAMSPRRLRARRRRPSRGRSMNSADRRSRSRS